MPSNPMLVYVLDEVLANTLKETMMLSISLRDLWVIRKFGYLLMILANSNNKISVEKLYSLLTK